MLHCLFIDWWIFRRSSSSSFYLRKLESWIIIAHIRLQRFQLRIHVLIAFLWRWWIEIFIFILFRDVSLISWFNSRRDGLLLLRDRMVVELRDRRGDSVILWLLGRGNGLRDNRDISLSSLLVKKNSGWGRYNILRSFWNRLREICVGLVERIRVVVIIFWRTLTTLSGWRWCWRMTRRGNYASDFAACLILFLKLKCSSDLNVSLAGSTSLFLQRLFHFFWLYILDVEGSLILMAWLSFWSLQWLLLLFLVCCKWSFLKNAILWFHLICAAQWHFLRQLLLFINFRTLLPYFANIATLNRLRRLRNLFCHLRNWLLPSLQYCQKIIDEIILNLWFACTLTLFLWIILALLQIPKQLIHCACFSSPWLAGVGIC